MVVLAPRNVRHTGPTISHVRPRAATSRVPRPMPPRPNPFLALLKTIQPDIERRLAAFLDASVERAQALGPEVHALSIEVRRLALRGGKRLRPALVVAGFRSVSGADPEPALAAGVALELLHTYFLIHDDWMDGD